ncbi:MULTISPECIES: hypothetical protein [Pseudomonas]|uniref:hypothetical protein n=1 Tax=Pseudomonas TaxID=286 RepID=UPI00049B4CD7|nr:MULTISPECIES: hypothetical protein [Pseudomonas]AIB44624.1 hypothetical protein PD374_26865 [Pseudomonas sp. WCS374]NMY35890.1 hypothetical protein [Pseudomonas sp. WS 5078]NMY58631.1 hypothetical protein [Pseudomonas sp. WS 5354]QXG23663.1 hypothetical protein KTT56_17865 [Pseudomonas viridiflava]
MPIDMDRYYTPENVAIQALERGSFLSTPMVCADSTCGSGRLLDAANTVFGSVRSIGIDRDVEAISQLRLRRPDWQLSVADLLCHESIDVARERQAIDLLVLNPPFSHGKRKFVDIQFAGKEMTGSIAMAHVLRSFEIFRPKLGAVVVAPESLLYSETDQLARQTLEESYRIEKIADLQRCTFRGARVQASVVQISPGPQCLQQVSIVRNNGVIHASLVRGSLPVHLRNFDPAGVPFIHSTDLRQVATGGSVQHLTKTSKLGKGRIKGWVILIPRVGLPEAQMITVVKLPEEVQLSDCVIALKFSTKANALMAQTRVRSRWTELRELYRGTGARYTTMARLSLWLSMIGVEAQPIGKESCT